MVLQPKPQWRAVVPCLRLAQRRRYLFTAAFDEGVDLRPILLRGPGVTGKRVHPARSGQFGKMPDGQPRVLLELLLFIVGERLSLALPTLQCLDVLERALPPWTAIATGRSVTVREGAVSAPRGRCPRLRQGRKQLPTPRLQEFLQRGDGLHRRLYSPFSGSLRQPVDEVVTGWTTSLTCRW